MRNKLEDNEVISVFQRYLATNDPSEIYKLDIEELVSAEERLGLKGINPNFRAVIKNKIKEMELRKARKYDSKIRAWNVVVGLILGLTIAGISAWIFNK